MQRLLFFVLVCSLFVASLGLKSSIYRDRLNPIKVANGTHFTRNGNQLTIQEPNRPLVSRNLEVKENTQEKRLPINGWYTSLWSFDTYTYFFAIWEVPSTPTSNTGQILFYFNSFESTSYNDILQPVLQFNNGVAGWTMASWYGDPSGNYYESTPYSVVPGDYIWGYIALSGSTWYIESWVNGALVTYITVATSDVGATQGNAQWTNEVYNVESCAGLPPNDAIVATDIWLYGPSGYVINPTWYAEIYDTADCYPGAFYGYNSASETQTTVLTWLN